jgi:N-acetylmuramoyl-L-alanine amidase
MRWSSLTTTPRTRRLLAFLAALLVLLLTTVLSEEKRITVYAPQTNYSLPVVSREGREYVGLLEVLEPLGRVEAHQDGNKWKLRFNDIEAQFEQGKPRARIRGQDAELGARFLIETGRGLVPLPSLATLIPLFVSGPVEFHQVSRRLFAGVSPTVVSMELRKTAPPRLVLSFPTPVNPNIATEPGKLRMLFTREPVVGPAGGATKFDDPSITSAAFNEANGSAELTIFATAPLSASFSDGGKTITITAAPQAAQTTPTPPTAAPSELAKATPPPLPLPPPRPRFLVVVDASHGGEERGAALSNKLAEKDVTLSLARRLYRELVNRGVNALLLRDGDSTMTLEQRAMAANSAHASLFVTIHAATLGNGVGIYTSLLPPVGSRRAEALPWDTAQSRFLGASRAIAGSVATELQNRKVATLVTFSPLRPLNNIAAPAIALEVAPQAAQVQELISPNYQQIVASSVASAIAAARPQLEVAR